MSPIRVLVVGMATLDHDIVRRIVGNLPDMTVVGTARGPAGAAGALAGVDVLVLAASESRPLCEYLGLMWTHPGLGVVAVDRAGPLRVVRLSCGDTPGHTWPDDLASAIRAAAE